MATEFHTQQVTKRRRILFVLLLVCFSGQVVAGPKTKAWRSLSRPEKAWVFFHPFKAGRSYACAMRARTVTDSLSTAGVLTDGNGGQLDAFRHAYWMALLVNSGFSADGARNLGEKHEKGNYLQFRKGELEDSIRPDSVACVMDLRNNDEGIAIGVKYKKSDGKISLIQMVLNEIWNGKLSILKKDAEGNYLTCSGAVIDPASFKKKWGIPKCIVGSDQIVVGH